ncbi:MAG: hypothetical protein WBV82_17725 [Myxococcaceae bacterium]
MSPSRVRASLTQTFLRFAEGLPEDVRTRIYAGFPQAHRVQIQKTLGLGWVPLEQHLLLLDVARQSLPGDPREAFRSFHRDAILEAFQQPFFKTIVDGFVRAFGLSPGTIMRAAPTGFSFAFRGCGEVTWVDSSRKDERESRLVLEGFPPEHFASGLFSEGMVATLDSFLSLCKVSGEASVTGVDLNRGHAEYVLRWRPA